MDERLIEVLVPTEHESKVQRIVELAKLDWSWNQSADGNTVFKLAVPANQVEEILDPLGAALASIENARLIVLPVEAILPRRQQIEERVGRSKFGGHSAKRRRLRERLSREELYLDVEGWSRIDVDYLLMTILSTVVAAIGLAKDNPTVVLAAMVIAPLLGPNMTLAVATTLGDRRLLVRALATGVVGLLVAALTALIATWLLPLGLDTREITSRTTVDLSDIVLGLAAGAAGALAITTGVASSLVGVMVAVALLPPLVVTVGLMVQGQSILAGGALLLLIANHACINLSALVVFVVQGVRPRGWNQARRSARLTAIAVLVWMLVLTCLLWLLLTGL